jgi:type VI protein secretion system component VasK
MRYIAIGAIVLVLLAFFGPMMLAAGRRIRDKSKETWTEEDKDEEKEEKDELEEIRSRNNNDSS